MDSVNAHIVGSSDVCSSNVSIVGSGALCVAVIGLIVVVHYNWLFFVALKDTVCFSLYFSYYLAEGEGYDAVYCVEGSFDISPCLSVFVILTFKTVEYL
ncbi:hypothetical protein N7501_008180 [Penicillium viridicatum]|nr:hypothetical protein N7501_008180 [Penicillium viridicatum]